MSPGTLRCEENTGPFATYMPAPILTQPRRADGLDSCEADAVARWKASGFAGPPCQHRRQNSVIDAKGVRVLNAMEREARLGFAPDHTAAAFRKNEKEMNGLEKESIRCSLLGLSFSCPIVAYLVGQWLHRVGVLKDQVTVAQAWGGVAAEPPASTVGEVDWNREVVKHLHRQAMYRGSDVRLSTGVLMRPNLWPRQAFDARRWKWRTIIAYPRSSEHINILELRAAFATMKWRLRTANNVRTRMFHLLDSQVCIGVAVKGRSSSKQMMRVLRRTNALVVAGGLLPAYGFVPSDLNPADAPSRWRPRKPA